MGITSETDGARVGRYLLHRPIARGGMATIHLARLMGDQGFSRIVAAKRLLPELAIDPGVVARFLDEARIASKVRHRNVVPVLDVVASGGDVILVQEYVRGASLYALANVARESRTAVPVEIAVSIAIQVLDGLQAAHEAVDEVGVPLNIVHRDVSPHNVMIALDGTARVVDFGIAKAAMAAQVTHERVFKGKLAYAAPEQLRGLATPQSDIYSLAVVLWELIVGRTIHHGAQHESEVLARVFGGVLAAITDAIDRACCTTAQWRQLLAVAPIVQRGLAVELGERWPSAAAMAEALASAVRPAHASDVARWMKVIGKDLLEHDDRILIAEEASWRLGANQTPSQPLVVPRGTPAAPEIGDDARTQRRAGVPRPPRTRELALAAVVMLIAFAVVYAYLEHDAAGPVAPIAIVSPPTAAPAPTPIAPAPPHDAPAAAPEPEPAAPSPAPRPRPPTRPPAAPPRALVHAAPLPPPRAEPTRTPVEVPAEDCVPPFYFEGTRKVFKSNCL